MPRMNRTEARAILSDCGLDGTEDFHELNRTAVDHILDAAKIRKYRKAPTANGSTARSFFEYLARTAHAAETLYIVQRWYAQGWEDETADTTQREGRALLRGYQENQPQYAHRLIERRVNS